MKKPEQDRFYIELARRYAIEGTCFKEKVGAVLVKDGRIIAAGYNGAPRGLDHCNKRVDLCLEKEDHCLNSLHAELNVLLFCANEGIPTEGTAMYVTHYPCHRCYQAMVQAGIKQIYYYTNYKNTEFLLNTKIKIKQVKL